MSINKNSVILSLITIVLIFPLFFQINGGVYHPQVALIDSGGQLLTLPLPISLFGCVGGMLLLSINFRRAAVGWGFIAGMLSLLLLSTLLTGIQFGFNRSKVILLLQFMLPTFALTLGLMVVDGEKIIAKTLLNFLLIFVPVQLFAGWTNGSFALTHNIYIFGIYQHFQYVPLIFVGAFSYAAAALWNTHTKQVIILMVIMSAYSLSSLSFLTIFAYLAFVTSFLYSQYVISKMTTQKMLVAVVLIGFTSLITLVAIKNSSNWLKSNTVIPGVDEGFIIKFVDLASGKIPVNVQERFDIWHVYKNGILESVSTVLIGHNFPLPRNVLTSAHNWYVDMLYNFGFIGLLPVIILIFYTMYLLRSARNSLTDEVFWLAVVVGYLVIVDNNFKVTLRQPYPGIFTYFLWGLLLLHLHRSAMPKTGT